MFLCNVDSLTEADASELRSHLARGGGLIVLIGEDVQMERYNRILFDVPEDQRILPAVDRIADRGEYHFDPHGYEHPIVVPFQGHEQTGLLTTPICETQDSKSGPRPTWHSVRQRRPRDCRRARSRGRCLLVAVPRTMLPATPPERLGCVAEFSAVDARVAGTVGRPTL